MKLTAGSVSALGLSAVVLLGGAAAIMRAQAKAKSRAPRQAARGRTIPQLPRAFRQLRDAARSNMRSPPREWDRVDEWGVQSFPASDPPCHCIRSRYG